MLKRKLDKLGRIVIPSDIREALQLEIGELNISVQGSKVIIEKNQQDFRICGEKDYLISLKKGAICVDCAAECTY